MGFEIGSDYFEIGEQKSGFWFEHCIDGFRIDGFRWKWVLGFEFSLIIDFKLSASTLV